jgi:3-oxoadipate enol-lactonase
MPQLDVNQTSLYYRFDGEENSPVVMLSNSLGADLTMWKYQIPALVGAGYCVLRYDSRGHGRSAVPTGPYTMDMLATDAVGLMDALGIEKVHFCGLSKGGMVGQMLGAKYGDRLMSLVLSSTSAYIPPPDLWNERIDAIQKGGLSSMVDATIDRWFTKPGQQRMPADVEKVRHLIANTPAEGFCACCAAIRDMDLRESITAISIPTLVIVGEQDMGTPVSAAQLIHGQIASSQLKIIPDAAHFVQMEQAEIFNKAILGFHAASKE